MHAPGRARAGEPRRRANMNSRRAGNESDRDSLGSSEPRDERSPSPDPLIGPPEAARRPSMPSSVLSPRKQLSHHGHHHHGLRARTPPSELPPGTSKPLHQHPGMPRMGEDELASSGDEANEEDEGEELEPDEDDDLDEISVEYRPVSCSDWSAIFFPAN